MFSGQKAFEAAVNLANNNNAVDGKLDIDKMMNAETGGLVDYGVWRETIELQKAFNDGVAPGWEKDSNQQTFDFWMALLDESVEVLGSKHWKWWKNNSKFGEIDWENIKVEMTDLFLFLLSIGIQTNSTDIIYAALLSSETGKSEVRIPAKDNPEQFFNDFWDRFLMSVQMKAFPMLAVLWVEFWTRLGYTAKDLFMAYRIKAALNDIRQEFGYGVKNSYKKQWPDPDNNSVMIEDNAAVLKLLETKRTEDVTGNTLKEFQDIIRKYYLTHNI